MLRRDVWHSCRHRDEDITPDDIERSFKNLLDSHALDIYERRAEMFKQAGLEAERIQSEQEKEQAAAKAIQARVDEEAAFQQSILDRQKEDARNRELAKTPEGMKELRRKSLYPQVRTSSQSVPMPQSVKHIAQNPKSIISNPARRSKSHRIGGNPRCISGRMQYRCRRERILLASRSAHRDKYQR